MKKQVFSGLLILTLAGCVATPPAAEKPMASGADAAIAEASDMLAKVQAASGEWKVIDKATGGKAVPLSKLLKVAKEKAAAGEADEATRIAGKVSSFAMLGIEQSKGQMDAKPYY